MLPLIGAILAFIAFVIILAIPKIPNWLCFPVMGAIVVFCGTMSANDVYGTLNSSSLHLMIIICIFSGMLAATGLDMVIGGIVERAAHGATGARRDMIIFTLLYVSSGLISTLLQNSYVAMAFLPVIYSISKKTGISYSKMILFVIYSTTLGGAITLIGTPTNVYANTALEEANLPLFGMLDFAWVAIPIFILGGLYMVLMNKWCASYNEEVPGDAKIEIGEATAAQKRSQKLVGLAFLVFIIALVLENLFKLPIQPLFIGYMMIALTILFNVVSAKQALSSLGSSMILFCAGINLIIAVMKNSGLGEIFADAVLNVVGESKNLYFITAVLFIGAALITQLMNNMATAGMLAPVGILIAEELNADPRAIVLTIAIGAGCSYLTPMASGTNQTMVCFSNLRFQDFTKFGWPLIVISFICCVGILPVVFPFF